MWFIGQTVSKACNSAIFRIWHASCNVLGNTPKGTLQQGFFAMPLRTASSDQTGSDLAARQPRATLARTKLDWAIIASLLAMGALNLMAMADQLGPAKAYAAPICGVPLA